MTATRCPSRHPYSDRQCTREAGHSGQHSPEEYTETEAEKFATAANNTLKQVVVRWTDQRMPIGCMMSTLMGAYIQIGRGGDFSDAVLLEMFVQMMGTTEPGNESLGKREILVRIAAMLDCSVEE